ncbi:hypothetical protein [Capnocytophaga sp. oral taxon 878]|uniref:hypothetical protein n=1 Tax=Capnocytophaga sp. oral taxon 878 TaxID=1316596 RepID=UPI000D0312CC|nr:hypothetical protein [Capnocytophaga sp. oral taxon 878]AVM51550.1 hypothetical protein C4H12_13610 [Capnocytophaga sp. oral taxon 878]
MDFDFINELRKMLQSEEVFEYSIDGLQYAAMAFFIFKMIQLVFKKSTDPKIGYSDFARLGGYIILVGSSSKIIDGLEDVFATIDNAFMNNPNDFYLRIHEHIAAQYMITYDNMDFFDMIFGTLDLVGSALYYVIFLLISACCKIADLSITAAYLVQRVFIIELLKFLLPLVTVLSIFEKFENLLISWVKRYAGMIILGVAYIAIIKFMYFVQDSIMLQFHSEEFTPNLKQEETSFTPLTNLIYGACIASVLCFTIKVKLMSIVTNYIQSYFS